MPEARRSHLVSAIKINEGINRVFPDPIMGTLIFKKPELLDFFMYNRVHILCFTRKEVSP